jgi:hypothetical protein
MNSKERKRIGRLQAAMKQQAAKHASELDKEKRKNEKIESFVGQIRELHGGSYGGDMYKYEIALDGRHIRSLTPHQRIDFAHMAARNMIEKLNEKFPCYEEWNMLRYSTGPTAIRKDTP